MNKNKQSTQREGAKLNLKSAAVNPQEFLTIYNLIVLHNTALNSSAN